MMELKNRDLSKQRYWIASNSERDEKASDTNWKITSEAVSDDDLERITVDSRFQLLPSSNEILHWPEDWNKTDARSTDQQRSDRFQLKQESILTNKTAVVENWSETIDNKSLKNYTKT